MHNFLRLFSIIMQWPLLVLFVPKQGHRNIKYLDGTSLCGENNLLPPGWNRYMWRPVIGLTSPYFPISSGGPVRILSWKGASLFSSIPLSNFKPKSFKLACFSSFLNFPSPLHIWRPHNSSSMVATHDWWCFTFRGLVHVIRACSFTDTKIIFSWIF